VQLALVEGGADQLQILATEDAAQDAHRQKEA
jgi:hypothetical protein